MRPRVLLNMSMSADGKIASENRRVSSFGSALDERHLYDLRGEADAILCGARTVDLNRISMNAGSPNRVACRVAKGLMPHPLRVIASGNASLDPNSHLFSKPGGPIVLFTTKSAPSSRLNALRKRVDAVFMAGESEIDFAHAFKWIAEEWGVRRLLCEGGGVLNDALFRRGLIDEVHLTVCPLVLGGRRAPTISDGLGFFDLRHMAAFKIDRMRRVGGELFLVLSKRGSHSKAHSILERKSTLIRL